MFMSGYIKTFLITIISILILVTMSGAAEFSYEENIHISNLHRIDDDLYGWGSNITIDGLVEGDLNVGGYTVNINGQIKNSADVFAFKLHHTGKIGGTLKGFVNSSIIDGYIGRSLLLASNEIRIGKDAFIEKDVYLLGNIIYFDGTCKEDAVIRGENIYITGIINGDLTVYGNKINILAPAIIKGNLTYTSEKEAKIELDEGVTIVGETTWKVPEKDKKDESTVQLTSLILGLSKLLAALLFGMILMYVASKYTIETVNQLRKKFIVSAATGLLSLLIFIFSIIVLIISVTCVIAGLALISGDLAPLGAIVLVLSILMVPITSFVTVSGGVLFYSGKIVMALVLGYYLIRIFKPQVAYISKIQLLLGLVILFLVFSIPYVGLVLYIIISIIGAGGIVLGIRNCRYDADKNQPPPPPVNNLEISEYKTGDSNIKPDRHNPPLPEPPHLSSDDDL